jgi:catechol 2,3-dioxygenase-like lactoylglutathione lyase family enzyme
MNDKPSFLEEIHYFRIPVLDLAASAAWYSEVLRLRLRRRTEERAVFEIGEGPLLVIMKGDAESRGHFLVDGKTEFSVGFTCPDIHRFRDFLIEHNVFVEPMQEDEGRHYFHFYDPSGNKLQAHW